MAKEDIKKDMKKKVTNKYANKPPLANGMEYGLSDAVWEKNYELLQNPGQLTTIMAAAEADAIREAS